MSYHVRRIQHPLGLIARRFNTAAEEGRDGTDLFSTRFRAVLSFALGQQLARERAATESSGHVRVLVRGCQLERSAAVPMYVAHAHVVSKSSERIKRDVIRSWFVPRVSRVSVVTDARGRHGRTTLRLAALNDNPHTGAALVEASARASYRIHANSSTALELVAHSGSAAAIVALLQSGVRVHTAESNECSALEDGHRSASPAGDQM